MCSILHLLHYGTGICRYAVMFWVLYHFCPFYSSIFFIFFSHYIFVLFLFNPIRYKQIFFLIKKCRFSMTTESANDKWQNNTVEQQKNFNALIQLLFWFVSSSTEARSVLSCFFSPLQVTDVLLLESLHVLYCHIKISILFCVWIHVTFVGVWVLFSSSDPAR